MNYKKLILFSIFLTTLLFAHPSLIYSLPEGEEVVSGFASFDRSTPDTLNINTPSERLIIDYNSFSIAPQEVVNFYQPSQQAVALNRVKGIEPSSIFGVLRANGRIFLVNPNGVIFGPGSRVDVAALVASTLNLSNKDFLAGRFRFNKLEQKPGSFILNQGYIKANSLSLLASAVKNEGIIEATFGSVALASGEEITLNLDTAGMISVVVDRNVREEIFGGDGEKVASAIENAGQILADGGKVILTAKVLDSIFDYAVNQSGVIQANSLEFHNGEIKLVANQRVNVAGEMNAEGGRVSIDSQGADFSGTINCEVGNYNMNHGDTNLSGSYSGDQTFSDNGNITVVGNLTVTGGNLSIYANNDLTVNNNKDITVSSGDIRLLADYDKDKTGELNLGKKVDITVGSNKGHYLQGANSFSLNGSYLSKLVNGDYLSVNSTARDITVDSAISEITGITLDADESIDIDATVSASSGEIALEAGKDIDVKAEISNSSGKVDLKAGKNLDIDAELINDSGTISLKANKDINIDETVSTTTGNITLVAGEDIDIDADITGENIKILADHKSSDLDNWDDGKGNFYLAKDKIIESKNGGDIILAGKGISKDRVKGKIDSSGDIDFYYNSYHNFYPNTYISIINNYERTLGIHSRGKLTLMDNTDSSLFLGERLILESSNNLINLNDRTITTGGKSLEIYSNDTGDFVVTQINAGAGDVKIYSKGAISDDGKTYNNSDIDIVGNLLTITAGTSIGASGDTSQIDTSGNIFIVDAGGNIYLEEFDGAEFSQITAGGLADILTHGSTTLGSITTGGDFNFTSTTGDITVYEATATSTSGGVSIVTHGGSIIASGALPHLQAADTSLLQASGVVASLTAPFDVLLTAGDLRVTISSEIAGVSGVFTGVTPSATIIVNNTPPGSIYFNGSLIWPTTTATATITDTFLLTQSANSLVFRFLLPHLEQLSLYQINSFDAGGPVYFYQPLTKIDESLFEGLALDEDDYQFREGMIEVIGHEELLPFL